MMGHDKETFEFRLKWGREVLLPNITDTDLIQEFTSAAKSPEGFAVAVLMIQDILAGEEVCIPIGLDVASSGPQNLSFLCRDVVGMKNTGVLANKPSKLYQALHIEMEKEAGNKNLWTLSQVKDATIPFTYGSNLSVVNVFGEDHVEHYEQAFESLCPWAFKVRALLLDGWDEDATKYIWQTPDGYTTVCPVTDTVLHQSLKFGDKQFDYSRVEVIKCESGMFLPSNVTHAHDSYCLRELTLRLCHDREVLGKLRDVIQSETPKQADPRALELQGLWEKFGCVSIAVAKYLKEDALQGLTPEYREALYKLFGECLSYQPIKCIRSIHDEFQVLPNDLNVMHQVYNNIISEAYQGNWLSEVVYDLTGTKLDLPEADPEIVEQIRSSQYAVH